MHVRVPSIGHCQIEEIRQIHVVKANEPGYKILCCEFSDPEQGIILLSSFLAIKKVNILRNSKKFARAKFFGKSRFTH